MIADRFTTSQVTQLRELFTVFADIAKIYLQFRPSSFENFCQSTDLVPKILDRQFSKILTELGTSMNAEPSDLVLLNLLPISFSRHRISYSLLFCQLIDLHQRMAFAECSEKSRRELFDVYRKFPYPRVLLGWPEFRDLSVDQNALIRSVREFRIALRPWHDRLAGKLERFTTALHALAQFSQSELGGLKEHALSLVDQLIQLSSQIQTFRAIQSHRSVLRPLDCPTLTFSDLNADADTLKEFKTELVADLNQIKPYLIRSPTQRGSSLRSRFAVILAEIARLAAGRDPALSGLAECGAALSALPAVTDRFCASDVISFHAVVLPSMTNLDRMIETLKQMIAEKQRTSAEIYDAVTARRIEAGRLAAVAASLKQRADSPDGQCRSCEESRVFVLGKCGHSFCERCMNRILESRMQRCPYPSCNVAFAPEDILRINWE
jgi:hypothetical protein